VERADEAHRQARAGRVEAILSGLLVEPYNVGIARVHARLAVEAMAKGRARPANDMMIAATQCRLRPAHRRQSRSAETALS
jgi:tRNA(fMet)-specific endonuclease VapC